MTSIKIAHSPDADDAFMFYALMQGKIDRGPLEFVEVREDIETLNQKALEGRGEFDVSAVSFHVYPYIADKYFLLSTGACFGENYGPVIVSQRPLKPKQLLKVRMAIPGRMTTGFMVLKLYEQFVAGEGKSGICYSQVKFDEVGDQVLEGKMDAGLLIHEGQLTLQERGLTKIADLGEWWHKETGLPLPLGGIVMRRELDPEIQKQVGLLLQQSIRYAIEHKEEALDYALPFARGLDRERASKFVDMYVNDLTVDMSRKGYKSLKLLLDRAYQKGIITQSVNLEECFFDVKRGKTKLEIQQEEESLAPSAEAV